MVEVAGSAHVGIGGDLDGVSALPAGIQGVQDLPLLSAALLEAGLDEAQVAQILGGNWLRILGQVWR